MCRHRKPIKAIDDETSRVKRQTKAKFGDPQHKESEDRLFSAVKIGEISAMKKLLLLTVCALLRSAPVLGASSSVSISDNKQSQSFIGSLPYNEQLLPAEDHSRGLGTGSQQMSYQQYQQSYDSSKQYNPVNTDVGYVSAASAQAPSQASITFGGSGTSANVGDNKYSANVPSYDTPIVQDSYGNPKPMGGYGRPVSGGYGPPSTSYGPVKGEGYGYQQYGVQGGYHDHYDEPSSGVGGLGSLFGGKGSLFSGFGGLSSLSGGLGGLGGNVGEGFGGVEGLGGGAEGAGPLGGVAAVKAVIIAIKAIKGILKFKSFFLFGLLFLLLLPAILIFLPIPVITITPTEPAQESSNSAVPLTPTSFFSSFGRSNSQAMSIGRQVLLELTDKVLGSEECLERIICKLPQFPKYQKQVKSLWVDYGSKYITNRRMQRGIEAYFEEEQDQKEKQAAKQRAFKCNQKFKCSNKFF